MDAKTRSRWIWTPNRLHKSSLTNALLSLSTADLIRNTLTPAVPTSVVIKLVATLNTAGGAPLAGGLLAWFKWKYSDVRRRILPC